MTAVRDCLLSERDRAASIPAISHTLSARRYRRNPQHTNRPPSRNRPINPCLIAQNLIKNITLPAKPAKSNAIHHPSTVLRALIRGDKRLSIEIVRGVLTLPGSLQCHSAEDDVAGNEPIGAVRDGDVGVVAGGAGGGEDL